MDSVALCGFRAALHACFGRRRGSATALGKAAVASPADTEPRPEEFRLAPARTRNARACAETPREISEATQRQRLRPRQAVPGGEEGGINGISAVVPGDLDPTGGLAVEQGKPAGATAERFQKAGTFLAAQVRQHPLFHVLYNPVSFGQPL